MIGAGAGFGDDEEFRAFGNVEAGHAGDRLGRLGDDLGVEHAVDPEHVLELGLLLGVEDIARPAPSACASISS